MLREEGIRDGAGSSWERKEARGKRQETKDGTKERRKTRRTDRTKTGRVKLKEKKSDGKHEAKTKKVERRNWTFKMEERNRRTSVR